MDSTYAPQSPDLSSFFSSPSKTQQQHYQPQQQSQQQIHHQPLPSASASTSYAPRSPVIPTFNNPAVAAPTSQQHLHAGYNSNTQQHPFGGGYGGPVLQSDSNIDFDLYGNSQYMPPIPALPPQHSFEHHQPEQDHNPSLYYQQEQDPRYIPSYQTEESYNAATNAPLPSPTATMTSRQPRGSKGGFASGLASIPQQQQQQYKDPNPNNIEIKTKFPVARIKRIMQADEEVGKVAQVTPVAVSKALELFMIALVSGAAEKAKEKGGKRVTAQHLKSVVLGSPEQFDFLAEIVGRVAEVTEGAGGEGRKKSKGEKVKSEEGTDSSEEEQQAKKAKKGKGRRKKSDD